MIVAGVVFLAYGGFRVLFGINIEHKNAFAVNSFILENHVDPNVSDDNLKELFYQLKKEGKSSFKNMLFYSSLVALASFIPLLIVKVSVPNLIIVVIGDVLAVLIVSLFTRFSSERFCSVFLRECREMMKIRNIKYDEKIQLITLKSAFYYFISLFILMIVIVLSFIPNPTIYLLGLIFLGFVFIISIVRMLLASILDIFKEVEEFFDRFYKEEKVECFTGSSYKEVINLSDRLSGNAFEIYKSRELEKNAYELEKKARIELEELDKNKTEFILTAQHHLRTPLTIVKGYIQAASSGTLGPLTDKLKDALERSNVASDRLMSLVNEFLNISQMEIGKSVLNLELSNIKPFLKDVIEELKPDMEYRKLSVSYPQDENSYPDIFIEPKKFKEVLVVLLDNAIKYNKDGGSITVTMKTAKHPIERDRKLYQITIENTGIGIKPDELPKLFTHYFERGEEAKRIYTTGRGLGLNIAKSIVTAHQGTIRAESEGEGRGARFIIELPIEG
jgi:signal transduction histidine kinase